MAQPRGFCAGVVRAIEIVERALEKYGPPVYVRHEIVHNKYVVESLKNKGAIFVEDLSEVPPLAVTVFSAHGVAQTVEEEAAERGLPPCHGQYGSSEPELCRARKRIRKACDRGGFEGDPRSRPAFGL